MRIWLIAGIAILAGCESEFDRCISTELPIAYESVGMEGELAAGEALVLLEDYRKFVEESSSEYEKWFENNPLPEQEEGQDIDSWVKSALTDWTTIHNAEMFRLAQDFGFPVNSVDEYVELQSIWFDAISRYVKPRSENASCTTGACDQTGFAERLNIQLREAGAVHERELKRLEREARLIAGRVCNSHGIYE